MPERRLRDRQPDDPPGPRPGEHVGEPGQVQRARRRRTPCRSSPRPATRRTARGTAAARATASVQNATTRARPDDRGRERASRDGRASSSVTGQPITVADHCSSHVRAVLRDVRRGHVERRWWPAAPTTPTRRAAARRCSPGTCTWTRGCRPAPRRTAGSRAASRRPSGWPRPASTPAYSTCRKHVSSSAPVVGSVPPLGTVYGGRRRVRQHDRARAAAAAAGEVGVVGVRPAVGDLAGRWPSARVQYGCQPSSPNAPIVASRNARPGDDVTALGTTRQVLVLGLGEVLERDRLGLARAP